MDKALSYDRRDVEWGIERVAADAARVKQLDGFRADIKAQRWKEVKTDGYGVPKGVTVVAQQGSTWEPHVKISIGEHAKLDCHVVWIGDSSYAPKLRHGCTKPTSHPKAFIRPSSSGSGSGVSNAQQRARQKRNQAIKAAIEGRRQALRDVLEGVTAGDATAVYLTQKLADKSDYERAAAAALLGLMPAPSTRWDEKANRIAAAAFNSWAREHGDGAALYALQACHLEDDTFESLNAVRSASEFGHVDDREQRRIEELYGRLRGSGYALSDGDLEITKAFKAAK